MCSYFFKDVKSASNYIYKNLSKPTPIKIQKSLYFVWAFYASMLGNLNSEQSEMFEVTEYPKELFQAEFEAWQYGPVIEEIWIDSKQGSISGKFDCNEDVLVKDEPIKKEIFAFINDLLHQIDGVNDFGLVNRSHMDKAWNSKYDNKKAHCKMNNEEIKKEYEDYVENQSKIE